MKKFMLVSGFALTMTASAVTANAESGGFMFEPYGAVGLGTLSIKQSGFVTGTPTFTKMGKAFHTYGYVAVGAKLHQYFALEMRLGATADDANNATTNTTKATADYVWSVLAKPQAYMTDSASVYGLLGVTTARIAGPGVGSPTAISTVGTKASTGFSYGIGAEYAVNEHISGGLEFIRYMKTDANPPTPNKLTLDSYTVNVKYSF
ncbi:MAG: hypothetical protein COW18_04590 [Zetaproteobacteria bacterium CG12_big_fil_rev_8_21_14_0_65_54_13]|nr:MAG: hypothetical protein COX55_01705 [Zetaproteobacteria bacterium CG23_combo_of_CG06-09_8_20_14_all_54_7]PIW49984.1 MAG: hypothetical protein COW18_04590 [Zetaproteobacteria bacterium CG12_big_fil_rev_8_21_14_0_65_54_13]PIX55866.1 MAG: hypothetical protein COZ50_00515 [Zetaproteobacteria bacterium CG_4_10_14_3_um_filter_54_28]PJA28880.1 MAG: hypothetical protein CO188_08050 [Zetaproteobacteria bacterium CG_4_9_14_3_um_filter_54_145]